MTACSRSLPSGDFDYYVRLSCKNNGSTSVFATDVANDNKAGAGCTPTTYDLSGSRSESRRKDAGLTNVPKVVHFWAISGEGRICAAHEHGGDLLVLQAHHSPETILAI